MHFNGLYMGTIYPTTEYSDQFNKIKGGIPHKNGKPFTGMFVGSCFNNRTPLMKYLNFQYIFGVDSE